MLKILAWITEEQGKYRANYTSSDAQDQPPATWTFPSEELARFWVYHDANLLGARVLWLDK